MSFLLDTDICSAFLKGNQKVWNRFIQHGGRLHVSVITVGELTTWAARASASPKRMEALNELWRDVTVIPVDADVATQFGQLRAALLDTGQPTPDMDLLIASTALVHGLALVTHNVADFSNVPDLQIEDWLAT